MIARFAIVIVALLARSALAENLDAESARHFVVGKLFAFTCRWLARRWPYLR